MAREEKDSVTISAPAQAAYFKPRKLPVEGNRRIFISRRAMQNIMTTVGAKPAETGGILLGPIGMESISDFVFDEDGSVSMVTYSPSYRKLTALCEAAANRGYELKGFCHSHPGLRTPSSGDLRYVEKFFKENPGLKEFYLPILPAVPLAGSPDNDCLRPLDWWAEHVEFYIISRENSARYEKAVITIYDGRGCADDLLKDGELPAVLTNLDFPQLSSLLSNVCIAPSTVDVSGRNVACLSITADDAEVLMFLPTEFPLLSPSVIVIRSGKKAEQYHLEWEVENNRAPEERLAKLVRVVLANKMFSTKSF